MKLITKRGRKVEIIAVDDYLRASQRGQHSFRRDSNCPVVPGDFDFEEIARDVASLLHGELVQRVGFSRGTGWVRLVTSHPAQVVIIDGMFLDSLEACQSLTYDAFLLLEAPWEEIANRRRHRDRILREELGGSYRTPACTEAVVEQAQQAYLAYARCRNLTPIRVFME